MSQISKFTKNLVNLSSNNVRLPLIIDRLHTFDSSISENKTNDENSSKSNLCGIYPSICNYIF